MESRKITVVSTKTQKKSVIMSGAETLGELKEDLRNAGIDYDGMTFYEGTSKTELKTDESVLPKDVPYTNRTTGETINTNELVFMLTNTNKKIRSGAMSRAEAYDLIRKHNLQCICVDTYGKNYTQCSTNALELLINDHVENTSNEISEGCIDAQARAAISKLILVLCKDGYINSYERGSILDILDIKAPKVSSPYSDNEIEAMFRDMD